MGGIIRKEKQISPSVSNLSNYKVNSIIGLGGFAQIKEVQDIQSKKWYAMKEFNLSSLSLKEVNIIKNELEIYKRLRSNIYIISLYSSFVTPTSVNFILDLLTGGDLRFFIRRNEVFNELKVSYIIFCIGSALNYLHLHSIIHRDVKPENIVFNSNGIPKLVDFGMSYLSPSNSSICMCQSRSGTKEYLAPEACVSKTHYHGYEVDFWSLGVIMYELLFKRRPFDCMVSYHMVKYSEETYKSAWECLIQQSLLLPPSNRRITRTSSGLTLDCLPTSSINHPLLSDSQSSLNITLSPSFNIQRKSLQKKQLQYQPLQPTDQLLHVGSFISSNLPPLDSNLIVTIPELSSSNESITKECQEMLSSLLDIRIHKRIGTYERSSLFLTHQWFQNNGFFQPAHLKHNEHKQEQQFFPSPIIPQLDEVSFQIWTQFYEKNLQNFQESLSPNNNIKLPPKDIRDLLKGIEYLSPQYNNPLIYTPEKPITYICQVNSDSNNNDNNNNGYNDDKDDKESFH